ncbi:MAG: MGMT family protein [Phycisphaerales bacterium]|nr:MGMT family protein [Phycisphaerales bacterium]
MAKTATQPIGKWRAKLEKPHASHGKIVHVPPGEGKMGMSGDVLIPKPLDVDALVRKVRKGRLLTVGELRDKLAKAAGADQSCPLTTGIFLRIVAEAAEEDRVAGKSRITPYWRVVKDDGKLNDKYPGGAKAQAAKLKAEGFAIQPGKGKQPPRVVRP